MITQHPEKEVGRRRGNTVLIKLNGAANLCYDDAICW